MGLGISILKPPLAELRKMGYPLSAYIVDTLTVVPKREPASQAMLDTVDLLHRLRFIIHKAKSVFKPTTEITFLDLLINSDDMKVKY